MINVLEMINSLESEIQDLTQKHNDKQRIIDKYERELVPLKQEVKDISDTLTSLQMALDSLNLVCSDVKSDANTVHEDELPVNPVNISPDPLTYTDEGMIVGNPTRRSTKPKGVYKKDPSGNILAEYRSVSEAARDNRFDPSSMRNVILKVSKDKQIRQRGVYYVYA